MLLSMKKVWCFLVLLSVYSVTYAQVKNVWLNAKDEVIADSAQAVTYAVYGKLSGDSVYTFKKFDFDGILLASGSFRQDSLVEPHGQFIYYNWITPDNNYTNDSFEINGRERFIELVGNYRNGLRQGRWISYYTDKKIKQVITFDRGILHGAYQYFAPNGKLIAQGLYASGKKNGTWILNGGKQEDEYENDKLISSLKGRKLQQKQAERQRIQQ
ncbi:Antitoxin component YwqK of the YwqJK toxin-antitoxin module [Pedobacter antarcticus]|nr:Antitoxin component YwqK of the YwqJK toxin-antitoxin module [Pedobacter antarcticus]SFF24239.1 Antitoxin component YwqK of the YwqJK toxin-antitoxin module [Pedobacter antarcticus]